MSLAIKAQFQQTLYTWYATAEMGVINLIDVLDHAPPETKVACIAGLETSPRLNDILAIANNAREEFRKRFAFPVVMWVTDEVEAALRRLSPDLASWAAPPFVFALERSQLQALLEQETAGILEQAYASGKRAKTNQQMQGLWQEWQYTGASLPPELEAKILLMMGMEAGSDETARSHLEQGLSRSTTQDLTVAIHYRLGLWWWQHGKQQRAEFLSSADRARQHLQQAWDRVKHAAVAAVLGEVLLALALPTPGEAASWQAVADFAA